MVERDGRQFGTVVGEISQTDSELAHVRFLGLSFQGTLTLERAVLEGAGIRVEEDQYFGATVNMEAEGADDLHPSEFEPFDQFKARELGHD